MEKQRICKICNKRYSNGKALGGHMRSHLAKFRLPPKPQSNSTSTPPPPPPPPPLTTSQSSSSSHINTYHEIEEMEISDIESESQYYNHKRRRSKRRRRSVLLSVSLPLFEKKRADDDDDDEDDEETLSAEDAAMNLIKLSKDKWGRKQVEEEDDDDDDEEETLVRIKSSKFKCETCNKVFGSYQALGGHKANHKKVKHEDDDDHEKWVEESSTKVVVDDHHQNQIRTFECPFCFKVFSSGQALGGHKKVHYSNNLPIIATRKSCRNNFFIDLNVPALEVE